MHVAATAGQEGAMESVWVEGLEIAYQRVGSGPPLVLLHGGLSDSRTWRRQLDALSDAFTVVAWDAPGCGRSSDPPEDFSMADYTACLAGLIDALSLGRPHVAGLSFGGGLTIAFYRDYPHIPRTLVPVSAYAGWAGSLPPDEVRARLQLALRNAERPVEDWIDDFLPTAGPYTAQYHERHKRKQQNPFHHNLLLTP